MRFNQGWADQDKEEIEEISPVKCFFGVACIIAMTLVMAFVVVVLLSEGGYNWN